MRRLPAKVVASGTGIQNSCEDIFLRLCLALCWSAQKCLDPQYAGRPAIPREVQSRSLSAAANRE